MRCAKPCGRGLLGWTHEAVRSLLVGGEPVCIGSTADRREGERYVGGCTAPSR